MLNSFARKAMLDSRVEVPNLLDDTGEKPADVFIPFFAGGKPAAIDISIVNPLSVNLLRRAAEKSGAALEERFSQKCRKYQERCGAKNVIFLPFVLEVFGGFNSEDLKIISKIARGHAFHGWEDYKTSKKHMFQRISVSFQTQLVTSILNASGI